jgi:hypothetical protein
MTISTTKGGGATGRLLRLAALLATTAAPFALAAPAQAQQNQASLRGTITSTAENPVTPAIVAMRRSTLRAPIISPRCGRARTGSN